MVEPNKKNPLIAWYDADPAGWKPFLYSGFCDIGVDVDSQARLSIRTIYAPYMWTAVTHGIVGNIDDPETSGLYNDGQYLINWKDERSAYVNNPIPANLAFGPHKEGDFPESPLPVFFPANHTVTFELTNLYNRILTPEADTFRIYIALKGLHYWGQLKPPKELLEASKGARSL